MVNTERIDRIRAALVEAGMTSAHASGRPDVVAWAASTAWLASWTPGQLAERERWTEVGLEALAGTSDRASEAVFRVRRAIEALERMVAGDQLQIQRLKKRKLSLKDRINRLEDQLTPDIIA